MKILFVAGRELKYSRTHIVYKALKMQGFDVVGCFPPDRSFKHYPKLIYDAVRLARGCDLILVGFYGQIILPFIKLFTLKPLLFDMYITTYDTMVHDRAKAKPESLKAKLYALSDWLSYAISQRMVLETLDHIAYFCDTFKADRKRFDRVFLAADDTIIYPRSKRDGNKRFLVHFHGEYAPFHGIKYILQAADRLKNEAIDFQIVGRGITYKQDRALARQLNLQNVIFYDPVPYEELADMIARADICLGIFGDNERVSRVTTNKVIESIAMAKPLITARNEPVQELLTHGESVYLVERASPQELAGAIKLLKEDEMLRNNIARGGYQVFQKHCTLKKLGQELSRIIKDMTQNAH